MKSVSLTKGNIYKGIIYFMIPVIIGSLLQQLYSLSDSIIVGQILGTTAFAGIGATTSASMLILDFSNGFASGITLKLAQYYGLGNKKSIKKSIASCYRLTLICGVILTIIGIIICKPLLVLLNTSNSLMEYAYPYLFVIFAGILATMFYNLMCYMLRALGNSSVPLIALIFSLILHIGLDLLFISVFNMGVFGAGLSTLVSQLISGIICFIYFIYKYPELKLEKEDFKFDFKFDYNHIALALPMAFQLSIIRIGMIVQQFSVNNLDVLLNTNNDLYATSYATSCKIDSLNLSIFSSLGTTVANFMSQNYGASNLDRIKKGLKASLFIGLVMYIIFSLIGYFIGPLMMDFIAYDIPYDVKEKATLFLRHQCIFYFLVILVHITRNALQGLNKSNITIGAGFLEFAMRIIASLIFAKYFYWEGLSFSNPFAWFGSLFLLIPAVIYFIKKFTNEEKIGKFGLKENI